MQTRGTWSLRLALVAGALAVAALLVPRDWVEPLLDDANADDEQSAAIDPSDLVFTDLEGNAVSLSEGLERGPVLVDFWATWCTPCKVAMPAYAAVQSEYAEHGFQVWAVSWDRGRAVQKIAPYFEKQGFTFPALLDPDQVQGRSLGVRALPTSFLFAPDGTIAWQHTGFASGDEKELESVLRGVLALDSP